MKRARLGAWAFFAPPVLVVLFFMLAAFSANAAVTFALRGDSLTPRYAKGGKAHTHWLAPATAGSPPVVSSLGHASVFGGQAIDFRFLSDTRTEKYRLGESWVNGTNVFSLLIRFVPDWTGSPPFVQRLVKIGPDISAADAAGGIFLEIETDGKLFGYGRYNIDAGGNIFNFTTASALSFTSGVATEIMIVSNGTNFYVSQDGVQVHSAALTDSSKHFDNVTASVMSICPYPCDFYLNELIIWDTAESHTYSARTDFLSVSSFDGTENTDPGEANVLTPTAYKIAGVSKTGTYSPGAYFSDLSEDDVLEGTSWAYNSLTNNRTGTYVPPDSADVKESVLFGFQGAEEGELLCTDPGEANVSDGVEYTIYSDEYVGTRETVTNVMRETSLRGQALRGTLRAQ